MANNAPGKTSSQMVKIINEPSHIRQFGMIVRMHRINQQHTLRSLAEKINISHAFLRKIEMAQTTVSSNIYDHLIRELGLRLKYDLEEEANFRSLSKSFYDNVLYYDVHNSEENMRKLKIKAFYYEKSLWMIDFLIIELGYLNFIRNMEFSKSNELYRQLLTIKDLMSDAQKQMFFVFSGAFFYHISDINTSLMLFKESQKTNVLTHLNGLTEYLIARSYSQRHHFAKANRHLKNAHMIFKANNNYIRTAYVKLINETYELLLNKRQDVEDIYVRTKTFVNQYNLTGVENKVNFLLSIYHYRKKHLDEALLMLQKTKQRNMRHFYYKAMTHLKLGNREEALKAVKTGRSVSKSPVRNTLLYKYAYDFIEIHFEHKKGDYETTMKRFFDEAINQKFYQESKDVYEYYVDYLTHKRKYKKAFMLTQRFTNLALEARH